MKKVNILVVLLTIALVGVSCESYDDYEKDRKTVAGFVTASKNITVPEGGSKTDSVQLFVSDMVNAPRTFNVISLPVDSLATAPENYSFENTVTVPANSRGAYFSFTVTDVSITSERNFFQLAIEADANTVSGGKTQIGVKN